MPEAETVMFAQVETDDSEVAADHGESTKILHAIQLPGREQRRTIRSTPRRKWLSRAFLLVILIVQATMSVRLSNTAFEDEALYLYVGHLEIAHLLHGAALQGDWPRLLSGAPVLYPVLAAMADGVGGLAAARAVSLVEMLAVTTLLYGLTRRMFNERVALSAAGIFAVTEPAIFLGHFATYDASALFLLALAAWIVVRTADFRWPAYLLAAPVLTLAVATKYAAGLFLPSVLALACLAAWPRHGRRALITPVALGAVTAGLIAGALKLGGQDYLAGISATTVQRSSGTTSVGTLIHASLLWAGVPTALAFLGAVAFTVRPFTDRGEIIGISGGRVYRAILGAVLAGSALLAPAEQIRIHTEVSLQKHIGFGLFFAAPIAGLGLIRLIGDHFSRVQLGIVVWTCALVLGLSQATELYADWPNSTEFIADFTHYLKPGAHYLVEVDEVPIYYLRHHQDAQPDQFTSTYYIGYADSQGAFLTGDAAYVAAIKAGYFRVVSYNFLTTPAVDEVIARTLESDPAYRLIAAIPNSSGSVTQYVWVHT